MQPPTTSPFSRVDQRLSLSLFELRVPLLRDAGCLLTKFSSRRTAHHIGFVVLHHVPNHRRQPTHHRHVCNLRPSTFFDPRIPRLHPRVASQYMHYQFAENEPGHGAALLRNRTKPIRRLVRITAAGRQSPVIRPTRSTRKSLDQTDSRGQRQTAVRRTARQCCYQYRHRVLRLTFSNLRIQGFDWLIPHIPLRKQQVYFQSVDRSQRQRRHPFSRTFRVNALGWLLLFEIVFPQ